MPILEFVGQSAQDADFISGNPSRLVNCYREPMLSGGRATHALKSVLGRETVYTFPTAFVRAMTEVEGVLYITGSGSLWSMDTGENFTNLGVIPDDPTATMAGNNGDVTVVADGRYFVWNGTTLTEPTPGAFDDFGSVEFFGNYTILTELNGRQFQWSDIADASTLPGLNFSTADGRDDNLLRSMQINGSLYLFKERSFEVWYLTGEAGASALERAAGGVTDLGLKASGLLVQNQGVAFFVGSDGRAHVGPGQFRPISTPSVETDIAQGQLLNCVSWDDEGHTFFAITFEDRPARVYDVATNEWHDRAEGVLLAGWDCTTSERLGDTWYCGSSMGVVSKLGRTNLDNDVPLVREATSRTLYFDGARKVVNEAEAFCRRGFYDGWLTLATSRDNGMTWGSEKMRTFGPVGNYGQRLNWRSLGQFRQANARLRWSAPYDVTLEGAMRVRV